MSAARPPDFEPLASSDPVPGNPDEVAALGKRYTDTAAEIAQQARNLRALAHGTIDGWKGKAGTVFQSHAAGLATRIAKAHARYATAGSALSLWAGPMADAQQRAYAAVWQAKSAQQQMTANAPAPAPPAGGPPPTPSDSARARAHAAAYAAGQDSLSAARRRFDMAVSDYHSAASRAAQQIRDVIGHDGLRDSWWDRNFGWISTVFKIIAIVVIVLAVVALIIACPFGAAFLAALGLSAGTITTIGSVVEAAMVGLTIAQLIFDSTAAATGKESWTAAILDLVALATFGYGRAIGAGVGALVKGATDTGEVVAAARAGRAAMGGGVRGLLYSLGTQLPASEGLLRMAGLGDRFDAAVQAAADVRAGLGTALKEAAPKTLSVLWNMDGNIAGDLAKLDVLSERVPGVLRITVPRVAAYGMAGINGATQWAEFAGSNGYTVYGWIHDGLSHAATQAGIHQAIGQFRRSLSRVP